MAANDIANHFIRTYEANVIQGVQQRGSKLRGTVTVKNPGPSEKHSFRVVSARGAMTSRNTASGSEPGLVAFKRTATPYVDTALNDRICGSVPYGAADSFAKAEVVRLLENPGSVLTQAQILQVGRTYDDVIIAALFATAYDTAGNATNHPAANQLGGAAVLPDFAMVRDLREAIAEKDIDMSEEVFLCVSPNFVSAMLDDPKATSLDFANGKALQSGQMVQGWMGFTWIETNRLTKAAIGPPAQIYGAAYTRDAVGLLELQGPTTDVDKDIAHWGDMTVLTTVDIGAVRIQDDKVFRVHYLESN